MVVAKYDQLVSVCLCVPDLPPHAGCEFPCGLCQIESVPRATWYAAKTASDTVAALIIGIGST